MQAERLVGLGVLANDEYERRNELPQLRDGEQRLPDVRGGLRAGKATVASERP